MSFLSTILSSRDAREFWENSRMAVLCLVALGVPLFFFRMGAWGLFDPDEGRYSEIPREMLARGDWITPHLNATPYFEKPPLTYWSVATFFQIFGEHEWVARLAPALAALAGVLIAYMLGRRMFGARAGFLGAIVLATSVLWAVLARELLTDMIFSVMLFSALALWWMGHSEAVGSQKKILWFLGFWAVLALAVLAKGPVAVVLCIAIIGAYLLICRPPKALREMRWLPGLVVFFAIAAPWFVLVAARNPQFNHFFWYGQHIGRFLGKGDNREHVQSVTYFIKWLPLLFFPWSFFVPAAIWMGAKELLPASTPRRRSAVFLLAMSLLILGFFSMSSSKLVPYILPIFPPMALLLGAYFDRLISKGLISKDYAQRDKLFAVGSLLLGATLTVVVTAMVFIAPKFLLKAEGLSIFWSLSIALVFALWLVALGLAFRAYKKGASPLGIVAATGGGSTLFIAFAMCVVAAIAPNHLVKPLLEYIQPGLEANGDVILYKELTQSVGFYTQRRIRIYGDGGEIRFGASLLSPEECGEWFFKSEQLNAALKDSRPIYCVVKNHEKAQDVLKDAPPGSAEIIWNSERSIIGNAAAVAMTPPVPGGYLALRKHPESTR